MSLEMTGELVWQTKEVPLAMLVAARMSKMAAIGLPPAAAKPFAELSEALVAWWPKCARPPGELYATEYAACLDAANQFEATAKMQLASTGATLQMAGLLSWFPRASLPTVGFRAMEEKDFLEWLRSTAKKGGLPLPQLEARLKSLHGHRKSWEDLIARTNRMHWGHTGQWSALSTRVRDLAKLADLGAKKTWISIEGQRALQLELDGVKRTTMLNAEELAALESVVPTLV